MTDRPILNSVPLDATPEMIQAALDLVWEDSENHDELMRNIWQAMAAVAPSAEPSPRAQALEALFDAVTLMQKHDEKFEGEIPLATIQKVYAAHTVASRSLPASPGASE